MRRLLLMIIALAALTSAASDRYAVLSVRADRAYRWQEWASAAAMYELMLDIRPDSAAVYEQAIVASAMIPDTVAAVDLLQRAMGHGIPLDGILDGVRSRSFAAGAPALYGRYLLSLRAAMPYMARALDHELLRYYTFRNDGPMMVHYSEIMLRGLPDSPEFLHSLAMGYLLSADYENACATWRRILTLDPADRTARLYLENYKKLSP